MAAPVTHSVRRLLPWVYLVLLWGAASTLLALGAHTAAAAFGSTF